MVTRNYYRGPMEPGDEVTFNHRGSTIEWEFPGNRPAYVTITSKGAKGNPGGDGSIGDVISQAQPGDPGIPSAPAPGGEGGQGGPGGSGNDGVRGAGGGGGGGGGAAGRSFVVYNRSLDQEISQFTDNPTGERFISTVNQNQQFRFGATGQSAPDNEVYPIVQISAAPFPGDNYPDQSPPNIRLGNNGISGGDGQVGSAAQQGPGGRGGAGGLGRASVTSSRSPLQGDGRRGEDGTQGVFNPSELPNLGGLPGNQSDGLSGQSGRPGNISLVGGTQPGATPPSPGQAAELTSPTPGQPGNRGGSAIFQSVTGPSVSHTFLGGDGGLAGDPAALLAAPPALAGVGGDSVQSEPGEPGQPGSPGGAGTPGGHGVGGQGGVLGRVAASFPPRSSGYDFNQTHQVGPKQGFFPDSRSQPIAETFSNQSSTWRKTWLGNASTSKDNINAGRMGIGGMASYWNVGGTDMDLGGPGGGFDQVFVRERPNMTVPSSLNASDDHPAKGYLTRAGQPGGRLEFRTADNSGKVIHRLGTPNPGFPSTVTTYNTYYGPSEFRSVGLPSGVGLAVAKHEVYVSVRRPLCAQETDGRSLLSAIPGGLGGGDGKGGKGGDGGAGGSITADRNLNMVTGQIGGAGGGGSSGSFATLGFQGSDGQSGEPAPDVAGLPGSAGQPATIITPGSIQEGQPGLAAPQQTQTQVYVKAKQRFNITLPNDDAGESFMTISWSPH